MHAVIIFLVLVLTLTALPASSPVERDDLFSPENVYTFSYKEEADRDYWDNVDISLLTIAPAEPVYIYFGHCGVVLEAPDEDSLLYDYGTFSFGPGFYSNFSMGLLYYDLSYGRFESRKRRPIREDRTMSLLSFDFTPEEKQGVAAFLYENSKKGNTTYMYHYYLDNCATRVRDLYDAAKGGTFKEWAGSISTGKSFRDYARLYLSPSLFFNLLLNYLQGPSIDDEITLWDACFLPDVLRDAISEFNGVAPDEFYTTSTRKSVPEKYSLEPRAILVGIALFLIIILAATPYRPLRTFSDIAMGLIYIFLGLCSVLLIFMMLFTNHDVTYGNINWLIISPLNLFVGINRLRSFGRNSTRDNIYVLSGTSCTVCFLALLFQLLTPFSQANAPYYILAFLMYMPEYYTIGYILDRRQKREALRCSR